MDRQEDLIDAAEARAILGGKRPLSKSQFWRLVNTGAIPHYRYSDKCVRFDRATVVRWRDSRIVATPAALSRLLDRRAAANAHLRRLA